MKSYSTWKFLIRLDSKSSISFIKQKLLIPDVIQVIDVKNKEYTGVNST